MEEEGQPLRRGWCFGREDKINELLKKFI